MKKVTITLTDKAEKYLNKLLYELEMPNGKTTTISDCINTTFEENADFEEAMDTNVCGFLEDNLKWYSNPEGRIIN